MSGKFRFDLISLVPLVFVTLFLVIVSATPVIADDKKKELSCSSYEAVYKPHPTYPKGKFDFQILVEPEKNTYPGATSSYFDLYMYDQDSRTLLSVTRLDFGCGGGSSPICRAGIFDGKERNTTFDVVALNQDFSRNYNTVSSKEAPYTLIFPNSPSKFRYLSWKEVGDAVRYYTDQKTNPKFAYPPEVWILSACEQRK